MSTLHQLHIEQNAKMGIYNGKTIPSFYNSAEDEYKAVRENVLLVDYSHLSIVSVIGDDAWLLVNYMASADISILRDEQGIYSLILDENGDILGDAYILSTDDSYYILSENITADDLVERLHSIINNTPELDIQDAPEIQSMDSKDWGAIQLEGPYAWELLSEIYGFDVIGLPYHEYMTTDDGLILFRCGKHGEFCYLLIGEQSGLVNIWNQLRDKGHKYNLKTGGLDYQKIVRVENPCWDSSLYPNYSKNPIALQIQWAIEYDKDDFIGKSVVEQTSHDGVERKLIGIFPTQQCSGINEKDKVLVNGEEVGLIINSTYSPTLNSFIALALIDSPYAYSDIEGYEISSSNGVVTAKTHNLPFIYNLSLLVNPTEHSYVDASKRKSVI